MLFIGAFDVLLQSIMLRLLPGVSDGCCWTVHNIKTLLLLFIVHTSDAAHFFA